MSPDSIARLNDIIAYNQQLDWLSIYVTVGLVCGGFCAFLANDKGRNPFVWFLAGMLTTIFALVAIGFASRVAAEKVVSSATDDDLEVRELIKKLDLKGGSSQG